MATSKPRARKQRIRREQVREAQRRRRERLRSQHQRFLQLLVPEDVHQILSRVATDLDVSVQQLALDLIRKALGTPEIANFSMTDGIEASNVKTISSQKVSEAPLLQENGTADHLSDAPEEPRLDDDDRQLSLF